MTISRSIPVKMRNVSDRIIEKVNTHYTYSNFFPDIVAFVRCGKIR